MQRTKKLLIITTIISSLIILGTKPLLAADITDVINQVEYTEEFKKYLELSDEEKEKVIEPRAFKVYESNQKNTNLLRATQKVGTSLNAKYSLKDIIKDNVKVRDQKTTDLCWAFASLSSLETNLALKNYYGGVATKTYDFSEKHMGYATAKTLANGATNNKGFNRSPLGSGNSYLATAYLTNGSGAVAETDMPFENKYDVTDFDTILNKEVITEVYDTIDFPSYKATDDTTKIKEQIKEHIKNNGAVQACIYGASPTSSDYYNNQTGALYCDDADKCQINHAVSIVGWDDDYKVENFNELHRPKNSGAWIIKNSWGEKVEYTLEEMKEIIFSSIKKSGTETELTDASQIDDETAKKTFEDEGYEIQDNKAILRNVGDNGFMYISYEDVNIYSSLSGIVKASDTVDYENIYQYNELGVDNVLSVTTSEAYVGNVFNKQTTGKEYLTQVSIYTIEDCECEVYVNVNGSSKKQEDLQKVTLKAGEKETLSAGYHTLEFANPVEINANEFAVVVGIKGEDSVNVCLESDIAGTYFEGAKIETNKCFFTTKEEIENNQWIDLSNLPQIKSGLTASDSTIKAFTTSKITEESAGSATPETPGEQETPTNPETPNEEIKKADFSKATGDIKVLRGYTFTNEEGKEYITMDIEVSNITKTKNADSTEYYYYLSPNASEADIQSWVKITETQTDSDKLKFTINTNDLDNLQELVNAEKLYVYVKEVATINGQQSVTVSKGLDINNSEPEVEIYVDGQKIDNDKFNEMIEGSYDNEQQEDNTLANKKLPNTGAKITIIISALVISIVGIVTYIRYRNLKKYIK